MAVEAMPASCGGFDRADWLLAWLATLLGAAVRWPALQNVPRFTDETVEIQFALDMAREGLRPIVSIDTYNGPLFHYLMALGFRLGAGAAWPRLLAFLFGSLTVGVTYLLANRMACLCLGASAGWRARLAGLLAALLLAVAMVPVVVNSHVAWSHATTPFWAALALLAAAEVWRRNWPAGLLIVAALLGLVQQSHWSGVVFLAAVSGWLVTSRRRWLRTRWPYLALVVWLAAVSNLLAYNLITRGGSIALGRPHSTTLAEGLVWRRLVANGRDFARLSYQVVGSAFAPRYDDSTYEQAEAKALREPGALLYGLVAVAGLLVTARRAGIALACWLFAGLLFPLLNSRWYHLILGRYVSPLLPVTYAAMATALVVPVAAAGSMRRRWAACLGVALLSGALLAHAGVHLRRHYAAEYAAGRTNARLWQIVHAARRLSTPERPVIVDRDLKAQRLTMGGQVLKAFDALMRADGTPYEKERAGDAPLSLVGSYLLIGGPQRDALPATVRLEPVDCGKPPIATSPGDFWVYLVRPGTRR